MASKNQTRPAQAGPEGVTPDSPLERFSRELAQRYPDRMIRRFVMPSTVREAREVFLLEITSRDEIEAAIMADALMSDIEKSSIRLSNDAERRECIRLAMCGLGEQIGATPGLPSTLPVTYRHTNHDGVPFAEINTWSGKAWTSLHAFFGTLNGVPAEEIASGLRGALTVGAFAPPTNAIHASADGGK